MLHTAHGLSVFRKKKYAHENKSKSINYEKSKGRRSFQSHQHMRQRLVVHFKMKFENKYYNQDRYTLKDSHLTGSFVGNPNNLV